MFFFFKDLNNCVFSVSSLRVKFLLLLRCSERRTSFCSSDGYQSNTLKSVSVRILLPLKETNLFAIQVLFPISDVCPISKHITLLSCSLFFLVLLQGSVSSGLIPETTCLSFFIVEGKQSEGTIIP